MPMAPQLLTDQHPTASVAPSDTSVDISHLVPEDDKPVDNFQSAQQQRFLIQTLYDSEALPVPFLAEANVGLFYQPKEDPIVPDVLLSLGIQRGDDYSQREHRSYRVLVVCLIPRQSTIGFPVENSRRLSGLLDSARHPGLLDLL